MHAPNLRIIVSAILLLSGAAHAMPAAAIGAETPPQSAVSNAAPGDSTGKPPLVIQNPDGTMTWQKVPALGKSEGAAQNGLVIPRQLVVPIVPQRANDQRNEAR